MVVGARSEENAEGRVLGRSIRITPEGWEYEADPRHAELIIREQNLTCANGVKSPGSAPSAHEEDENKKSYGGLRSLSFGHLQLVPTT